jgi:hypothetical protein
MQEGHALYNTDAMAVMLISKSSGTGTNLSIRTMVNLAQEPNEPYATRSPILKSRLKFSSSIA